MISNWIPLIDFLPDLTQTCRLGEIHISLFLASATSRISLKVQSHAAAEKRFREGGHSDERAIHREISGKGSEGEKEMQGEAEAEMCVCISTCKWSACVCVWRVREKHTTPNIWDTREGYNWVERVAARKMIEGKERRDTNLTSLKIN